MKIIFKKLGIVKKILYICINKEKSNKKEIC